jgi:HD domain-containing protein
MNTDRIKLLQDFIYHLAVAVANASLYSADHPQVTSQVGQAMTGLENLMADVAELSLVLVDDLLFYEGKPLERSLYLSRFGLELKSRGIGQIKILRTVTLKELKMLIRMLARQGSVVSELRSSDNIRFGKVDMDVDDEETSSLGDICSFDDLPLERLAEAYMEVENHGTLRMTDIVATVSGFIKAFRREVNPLLALAPLRSLDEYTFAHSVDVCILNLAQGISVQVEGELLHDLGIAGMLHDVGKLFVPKEITGKPEELTAIEWEEMRRHPVTGAKYLLDNPGVPRLAVLTAFEHHMKYDLSGYPPVPAGWQLNICSQMTMISDCFDALRTRRIYKEPLDFGKTAGIMLGLAGKNLNPELTLNFLKVLKAMGEH